MVLLSCLTLTALSVIAPKSPRDHAPLAKLPLTPYAGGTRMMTVDATVSGAPGTFVLDTGGGITYITPAFAARIGKEPWGQISGFTMTGQRLDMQRCDDIKVVLGGQRLHLPSVGVFDIMKFMPAGIPAVDGSIGLDVFSGKVVSLDLEGKELLVESPDSLKDRMRTAKEVPLRLVREAGGLALAVQVAVTTPKGRAWMELDSGNGGANVVGKHVASLLKLDSEKREAQPSAFDLVGGIHVDDPARVNPNLTMDGNLGVNFLKHWIVTLDLKRGRAWLSARP